MKVRTNLRLLMAKKRINSISELSEITSLPYSTLLNFYNEKYSTFNGKLIITLCELFGCQVGDLLYLEEENKN